MGSWFHCPCGNSVHKNLFTGCGVKVVVDDAVIDMIPDEATADEALRKILSANELMVRCGACGRIAIEGRDGCMTVYRREG